MGRGVRTLGEEHRPVTSSPDAPARPAASVRRTMIWLTLGTLTYLGVQWLLTALVVRISGQSVNGDYTLALSASSVAYAMVLFGMRPFQISDTRGEYADVTYLASRVVTSVLAAAAFALTLPFTVDVGRLWPVLVLFVGFRITEGWMDVLHGVLQNADRMDRAGIALILRAFSECAAFVAALVSTQNLSIAVGVMFGVSTLALLVLEWPWARRHLDGVSFARAGGWPKTFALVRACAPLLVANLAYSLMLFIPRNAIGAINGQETLGFYGSIAAPLLLVPVLVSYLYTPFMPQLAERHNAGRDHELTKLALRLLAAIVGLVALAFLLLPFVGPPALELMFGSSISSHLDLLYPVAGSVSCTALVYFGNAVLTSVRRVEWTMIAAIVALAIVLASSSALVTSIGPNGASLALIIAQAAQAMVLAYGFATRRRPIWKRTR